MNILQQLIQWDKQLFSIINQKLTGSFLDWLFPILRNQAAWYPLYFLLQVYSVYTLRKKNIWWVILFIVAATTAYQIVVPLKNCFEHHVIRAD